MNNLHKTIVRTVVAEDAGQRLDRWLSDNFKAIPRSIWHARIKAGLVQVGNTSVKPSRILREDEVVTIDSLDVDAPSAGRLMNSANAEPMDIPILYIDHDVIVINKPAGIAVHEGVGQHHAVTIAGYFADKIEDGSVGRPGIVHRLDKDTSGVMVLARHQAAADMLRSQFKGRTVEKTYLALVWGELTQPQARIELPLARHHSSPVMMAVSPAGKAAITEYKTIDKIGQFSLLELHILTGRMHQIRVHLSYLGHPVVGDKLYSKKPTPNGLRRQFLHAHRLSFDLPAGKRVTFIAELPADLSVFIMDTTHV